MDTIDKPTDTTTEAEATKKRGGWRGNQNSKDALARVNAERKAKKENPSTTPTVIPDAAMPREMLDMLWRIAHTPASQDKTELEKAFRSLMKQDSGKYLKMLMDTWAKTIEEKSGQEEKNLIVDEGSDRAMEVYALQLKEMGEDVHTFSEFMDTQRRSREQKVEVPDSGVRADGAGI